MSNGRKRNGTFAKGHSGNPSGIRKDAATLLNAQVVPGLSLRHLDGWVSSNTGIGDPSYDKRLTHRMQAPILTYAEAVEIWRADDIAKRAIEAPIDECFRQGYEITISDEGSFDDLKEAVEEKIETLRLNDFLKRAKCLERALGGAAILIGADDHLPLDRPLDPEKVTALDWLTLLEPIELTPIEYYNDPLAPKYGEVEFYELTPFTTVGAQSKPAETIVTKCKIHESRLVVFGGIKVSRYQIHNNVAGSLWGDSKLTSLIEVLRDFNVAWHSAGLLAVDFGQPVISVDNLMLMVAKNPADFQARMRALEQGRSSARAILIDGKKEKFERQTTNLSGIPELLNGLSMRLAAAVDMPLTLLMGMSPKGLGNEGESDVRFYYDRIRGKQITEIGPLIRMFVKLIMATIRKRKLPKKWGIAFHELWQMSDSEKADARLTQARTDSMYLKGGVLYPDEVRKARFGGEYSFETQINEDRKAPGFVAPPPRGTPGSVTNPAVPVAGHTRTPPVQSGTEPAPPQGGDKVPKPARDAMTFAGFHGALDGYVEGVDGTRVDCYLGSDETAPWVYVIHQNDDADKVMLGFQTVTAAVDAYVEHHDEHALRGLETLPVETFRRTLLGE